MMSRVYRNLNNGRWSIQQRVDKVWTVVGHASACTLADVTVNQSIAGRDRARRNNVRNVHCSAQGQLVQVTDFQPLKGRPLAVASQTPRASAQAFARITYNPFIHDTLIFAETGAPLVRASVARFTTAQKMEAQA